MANKVTITIKKNSLGKIAPLCIGSGTFDSDAEFPAFVVQEIDKQVQLCPQPEQREDTGSWTGDVHQHAKLHHDPNFDQFFKRVYLAVGHYLGDVGINPHVFHYEVVRSWGTKTNLGEAISPHAHEYCSLSLVYYPFASETDLFFEVMNHPNEVVPGIMTSESYTSGVLSTESLDVSNTLAYTPGDDMYVIFPAKTKHYTRTSEEVEPRYSIAVDIYLTLKDSEDIESNMSPKETWRRLEDF